jgi:hypothetical protein
VISVGRDLQARVVAVLRKLERISEGRTLTIDGNRVSRGKNETALPRDVDPDRPADKPPSAGVSLFEHFRWRLEHAPDEGAVRLICRSAELAYEERVKGADPTARHRRQRDAAQEAQWVIEHGVGLPADEIAAELQVSPGWVEKVRREHRQRPADGRPLAGFLGWDDDRRYREVQKLKRRGMKQAKAALALGVAKRTVQRYWVTQSRQAA